jgi:DNA-binding Lrp family transcriptional regulator
LVLFNLLYKLKNSLILAEDILLTMPTAYVLINCDLGSEEEIIKELKKLPEVLEVSGVYGVYDIILKITSDTMDKLRETITWHVRRIDKVRSTLTMIVIEGQGDKGKN